MEWKYIKENVVKNVLAIVILVFAYSSLQALFATVPADSYESIILATSILILAFLFADYAFEYHGKDIKNWRIRMLGHTQTFLTALGTGLSLEVVVIVLHLKMGVTTLFFPFIAIIFYASLVMYDFWDLLT